MVGLFDECIEHTPRDTVIALTRRLRETQADLIVSIGGGTVIDTVKVALVCLAEGVDDVDAMSQWHMRVNADGTRHTPQPRMPPCRQIAVPTTLSGAEFSDLGGCTDTRNGTKQGYTGSLHRRGGGDPGPAHHPAHAAAAVAVHRHPRAWTMRWNRCARSTRSR